MPLLNDQDTAFLRNRFAEELVNDVRLVFFSPTLGGLTIPGEDAQLAEYTRTILKEVASLSDKITVEEHSMTSEADTAAQYGITRSPATAVIGTEDYGVRYYGMPGGYEFLTLVEVIIDVSKGRGPVSAESAQVIGALPADVHLQVFVTPT
jgi:alkyl hydroperoxide reductase subunit AhpF